MKKQVAWCSHTCIAHDAEKNKTSKDGECSGAGEKVTVIEEILAKEAILRHI